MQYTLWFIIRYWCMQSSRICSGNLLLSRFSFRRHPLNKHYMYCVVWQSYNFQIKQKNISLLISRSVNDCRHWLFLYICLKNIWRKKIYQCVFLIKFSCFPLMFRIAFKCCFSDRSLLSEYRHANTNSFFKIIIFVLRPLPHTRF